ncbi:MAG: cation transporting ATPase C-terminal domain-containing protein [Candidatus Coprovivens sp.]
MNTTINIILSIILLMIIIVIKIINYKKNPSINKESTLYIHEKKLCKILTIISIILIPFLLITNKILNDYTLINNILNTLSITLLVLPISIHNLYNTYIKNEEELLYTKTIITTKEISKKLLKQINKSHINVVLITTKETNLNLPIINKEDITTKELRKNIIINSNSYKTITNKYNQKLNFIYTEDVEKTYNEIINSRGVCDNYIRTIKYNIIANSSLLLSMFFINYIMGFPFPYTLSLTLLIKLTTLLTSHHIYKKLPYDIDINTRTVRDKNTYLYKQEKFLMFFQISLIMIGMSLPYMYFMAYGTTLTYANTVLYLTFIFSNIFLTLVNLSEEITIKNILKIYKSLPIIIYIISLIIITIILYYLNIFETEQIGLRNYLASAFVALVSTILYDITKFARYTTMRGSKKHEHKNNKKHK